MTNSPAVVYRAYDGGGRLLYVGCTGDIWARMIQHETSPWVDELAALDITRYPDREQALAAEREAIITEWPLWNYQHSPWLPVVTEMHRRRLRIWLSEQPLTGSRIDQHFSRCQQRAVKVRRLTRDAERRAQLCDARQ